MRQFVMVFGLALIVLCLLQPCCVVDAAVIRGHVVDRQGRAVEGVAVFHTGDAPQRIETLTDAEGGFLLEGVPDGIIPVFAEKSGYRFTGSLSDTGEVALTLTRIDDPSQPLSGAPQRMSRPERLALAHRLLDAYLTPVSRKLLRPAVGQLGEWARGTVDLQQKAVLLVGAAAVVDPEWAAELLTSMPDPPDLAFRQVKHQAFFMLVRMLGMDEAALWNKVSYWRPQDEDLP